MSDPISHVFAALSDPTRRRILTLLLEDDMAVTDVAAPFGTSLASISKHLAVLDKAGLIHRERRGRVTWCKLDTDAFRGASLWMATFGLLDAPDLDGLERFLSEQGLKDETHDRDDDHDNPDEINDAVHLSPP